MPDWKSMAEAEEYAEVSSKLEHAIIGLYLYDWLLSLDFDWQFISGKRRFRWPMLFYFAGRYLLLFASIGILISLDTTTPFDCQTLFIFNQLAGNAALGIATINLSIRTMAIWSHNKYLVGILVVLIMGHWSLILQGVLIDANWEDGFGCEIVATNNKILAATFIYAMCLDLIILVLNAYKLLGLNLKNGQVAPSRIARMMFQDGLVFFIIAFLANLLATVFMLLDLNPTMSVIFNLPAIVASTIVASRVVRRLAMFTNDGPEVFSASTSHSQGVQRNGFKGMRTGVHVQMETFTHAEDLEPNLQSGGDRLGDNEEKIPRLVPEGHDTDTEDEGKGHHL